MKRLILVVSCFLFLFYLSTGPVFANKSTVTIEGPASAEKGSEVVVKITATHNANSFLHYTKWLKVQVNGKPVEQWDYSAGNRPDDATFTKEVRIKVTENTEVVAEASCNIHGSTGPAKLMILIGDAKATSK